MNGLDGTPCVVCGKLTRTITEKLSGAVYALSESVAGARESFLTGFREGFQDDTAVSGELVKTPEEALTPVLKEIKDICRISGLTQAIDEMHAISLRHSSDPVVERVLSRVESLSMPERERLSQRFLDRLSANPFFGARMHALPADEAMSDEDFQRMSSEFIRCVSRTLEDAGVAEEDVSRLLDISDDISRPLNELIELYLRPKTLPQKIRRIWRLQRVFLKTLKLIRKADALALSKYPVFTPQ